MAKQTKLELVQINARLASENEALRKQVADLELKLHLEVTAYEQAHAALVDVSDQCEDLREIVKQQAKPAPAPKPARAAYVMPAWQVERAAAMAKAKAAAMLMGRTVSVGQ